MGRLNSGPGRSIGEYYKTNPAGLAWEAPCGEDYAGQPDDCDSGNCVSVASIDGGFAFRDTKPESDGSVQYYSHDELIKLGQWLVRQYDLTPES